MKSTIKEFQKKSDILKDEMFTSVVNLLSAAGMTSPNTQSVYDFIEYNYDLLEGLIETIEPKDLLRNYQSFVNSQGLNEAIIKVLKEEKDTVEPLDKSALFQDLADVSASLSDAFSKLYQYKNQYIENPEWRVSLSQLRVGVSDMMKKVMDTMNKIGLQNDVRENK